MTWLWSGLAGLVCGTLSGFGIGGGSLLMVWMTAILSMEQRTAQAINLLFFLPSAICSLVFHIKQKQIVWKTAIPAMVAGGLMAGLAAWIGQSIQPDLLRKLFGGFLLLVGISQWLPPTGTGRSDD